VKSDLLQWICCPGCKSDLALTVTDGDATTVTEGALTCTVCAESYPIVRGVPRFVKHDGYVGTFSYEWQKWGRVQFDPANGRKESEETFTEKTGFVESDLRGKLVLDVGCGAGRFLDVASRWGATVVGIDLSFAVEASQKNVGGRPNVSVVQADVFRLPFRDATFDAIFSIGVLHHSRDTREAFLQLPKLLKEGGDIAVWLYYYQDRLYNSSSDFWRAVLRPFPTTVVYAWSWLLVTLFSGLWAKSFMARNPWDYLRRLLPVNIHPDRQWRILDTFDWYSPRYQDKDCSPGRVFGWCLEGQIRDVRALSLPTSIRGTRDTAGVLPQVSTANADIRANRVLVFGAGAGGRQFAKLLRRIAPGTLTAIADNDQTKQGMHVEGVAVQRFEDVPRHAYDIVVIASLPGRDAIRRQLEGAGLVASRDFVGADEVQLWHAMVEAWEERRAA
jgi:SAM-dependent methyltransferase